MYWLIVILVFLFQNFVFSWNFDSFFLKLRPSRMYLSPIFVRRVWRWFWHVTRDNSQARHETLWLVHHRLLKKRDLNKVRHEHWGYTRGSKARASVPIYIFALALSRVPSARVYSWYYNFLYQFRLHLGKPIFQLCVPFAGSHHIFSLGLEAAKNTNCIRKCWK